MSTPAIGDSLKSETWSEKTKELAPGRADTATIGDNDWRARLLAIDGNEIALDRLEDIVRSGRGYRNANPLVRELVLSVEVVAPMAVIKTPPGTANLVARRIDEAALPGIAGTVAGDDTIIAILRQRSAGRALKDLLANVS